MMGTAAAAYGYSGFSASCGSGGAKNGSTATRHREKNNKGIAHSTIRRIKRRVFRQPGPGRAKNETKVKEKLESLLEQAWLEIQNGNEDFRYFYNRLLQIMKENGLISSNPRRQ